VKACWTLRVRPRTSSKNCSLTRRCSRLLDNLDCGGLRHVIVGYGNFNQVILETHEGHLSVCVELDRDPVRVAAQVADMLERRG
jgi:hypothetical protein